MPLSGAGRNRFSGVNEVGVNNDSLIGMCAAWSERLDRIEPFDRRTGTEEISVAVNIVDARDGGPEFVFACPRRGKRCLFT